MGGGIGYNHHSLADTYHATDILTVDETVTETNTTHDEVEMVASDLVTDLPDVDRVAIINSCVYGTKRKLPHFLADFEFGSQQRRDLWHQNGRFRLQNDNSFVLTFKNLPLEPDGTSAFLAQLLIRQFLLS